VSFDPCCVLSLSVQVTWRVAVADGVPNDKQGADECVEPREPSARDGDHVSGAGPVCWRVYRLCYSPFDSAPATVVQVPVYQAKIERMKRVMAATTNQIAKIDKQVWSLKSLESASAGAFSADDDFAAARYV
jgi:hypothetical protein